MLRLHDTLFIGRQTSGGVRLIEFTEMPTWPLNPDGIYKNTVMDLKISKGDWIRAMAYCSHYYPKSESSYLASELHTGER